MPVMCSFRNALSRARSPRTCRYDSRTLLAEPIVVQAISGRTANATSASRQFITSIAAMMPASTSTSPKTVIDARREQIVEGVDVGRDARHQPADRIAVVEPQVERLQVAVDLACAWCA